MTALCVMSWAQTPSPTPAPQEQPPAQTPAQAPAQTPSESPSQVPPPEATQLPTTTPTQKQATPAPQFPRTEIFGGGSYAETGLFNAGHWAGLAGWDASLALNATDWLGIIVDGGQYFGTSQIPTATPAPFQGCGSTSGNGICSSTSTFDVSTREYNILFGLQFSRRKYERWTPFGEILYGHQGTKGVAGP